MVVLQGLDVTHPAYIHTYIHTHTYPFNRRMEKVGRRNIQEEIGR
jgi:hypothetical protein